MGPIEDPGYLALAAGERVDRDGKPPLSEEDLLVASGRLGMVEEFEEGTVAEVLGRGGPLRTLAVVVRALEEARRSAWSANAPRGELFASFAYQAGGFLDPFLLGAHRVERIRRTLARERANAHRRLGHLAEARALLAGLGGPEDDPVEAAELAAYEAAVLADGGELEAAVERVEGAVGSLPDGTSTLRARLLVQAGSLAGWFDTTRSMELLRRAVAGVERGSTPRLYETAQLALAWWRTATVDAVAALGGLSELRSLWLAGEEPWGHAGLRWTEARLLARLEHLAAADAGYEATWALLFDAGHSQELLVLMEEWLGVLARRRRLDYGRQVGATAQNLLGSWRKPQWMTDQLQERVDALERPAEVETAARRGARRLRRGWWQEDPGPGAPA